jgi:hypothetical protein
VSSLHPRRQPLRDPAAEQIACSADRLEAQATAIRPNDKALALTLLKEAERLRRFSHVIETRHKRDERARLSKKNGSNGQFDLPRDSSDGVPRSAPFG